MPPVARQTADRLSTLSAALAGLPTAMRETLPALIAFAAAMSFTPGPNNTLVTASGASFGFRRSLPLLLGVVLGFALMVVGLGAARLFQALPVLHEILKVAGSIYLLWLAWRIARAGRSGPAGGRARPISFVEATAFQWINPKGWVFAAGALSAFTTVGGDLVGEVTVITVVLAVACLAGITTWCAFGVAIGRLLTSDRALAAFNWSMAGLLALSVAAAFV
ncbi:MAG TPA: LysE family translocator [Vicinamibacteria bacterium]|nr:LysE family translocator [Vicinamibacteria bacterium]